LLFTAVSESFVDIYAGQVPARLLLHPERANKARAPLHIVPSGMFGRTLGDKKRSKHFYRLPINGLLQICLFNIKIAHFTLK
jgi:hypothetical protein